MPQLRCRLLKKLRMLSWGLPMRKKIYQNRHLSLIADMLFDGVINGRR